MLHFEHSNTGEERDCGEETGRRAARWCYLSRNFKLASSF